MLTSIALVVLAATPALPVTLKIEPRLEDGAPPTSVVFRVTNTGETPLRAALHRGLLSLEVRVPGWRAPVRCPAPAGTRPGGVDPERVVDLAPGASVGEVVDLRWYCWSGRAAKALAAPGATLVGRYGFGRRRATSRTWVAASADGAVRVASLEAEPVALPAAPPVSVTAPARAPVLSLGPTADRLDSASGRSIPISLQLRNEGHDDMRVLVRPEMFRFAVRGPGVGERCALPTAVRSPMRETFTRLAPRGRATQTLDLASICPGGTFAAPGLYEVESVFESDEDGGAVGLRAFAGSVKGARALVRVTAGDLRTYEPVEAPR